MLELGTRVQALSPGTPMDLHPLTNEPTKGAARARVTAVSTPGRGGIALGDVVEPYGELVAMSFDGERLYWFRRDGDISLIPASTWETHGCDHFSSP